MKYHAILRLPGDRKKSLINKSQEYIVQEVAIPFKTQGVVSFQWGGKKKTYQVIDVNIYKTSEAWDKKKKSLDRFLRGKRNIAASFISKAEEILKIEKKRVFIIMPIQGDKFGTQDDQRIFQEYDRRFQVLEKLVQKYECVAIRIDKEVPLSEIVTMIKKEIRRADFIICDLTDERPSCYFEAGYAEALKKNIIYIASKESVINPKTKTNIHFDIHMNVNKFSNHEEMTEKIKKAIDKHKKKLFDEN